MTDITDVARTRYTTKAYTDRKISSEDEAKLFQLLQLAPSSVNLQPWHFIVASTAQGKARVAKSAEGAFSFNASSIATASHTIVFTSKTDVDEDYMLHILDQEDKDGRYATPEIKDQRHGARTFFAGLNQDRSAEWNAQQLYLNLGAFLLGAAALGIDATPMEGVDTDILDQEFGLTEKGYKSHFVVVLGYRAEDDFNAKLPKSRLPSDEVITQV